jgi:o-succinylbenzoate synthase
MPFTAEFAKRTFHFSFDARTSRGQMRERHCWFLTIMDEERGVYGKGEAAPLPGLSPETNEEVEQQLERIVSDINSGKLNDKDLSSLQSIHDWFQDNYASSVTCALETALLDLGRGGKKIIFNNSFSQRETGIATNGLIWIGGLDSMLQQVSIKIEEGFRTLKIKIGSLDFEKEIDILQYIKRKYFRENIEIRLDANGAFKPNEVLYKLNELSRWGIHSIEQPVMAGQQKLMTEVCAKSPIPIALDEELIGITGRQKKIELLQSIKPKYIILKPSLMGGFYSCQEWIDVANANGVDWWITSALESALGLNAVAQFTAQYPISIPQGLGTGQIYIDNIESPLEIHKGQLKLSSKIQWEDERKIDDEELI